MAERRRGKGKPFPPGVSGNPKGRTPVAPQVREARQMNLAKLTEILTSLMAMSIDELNSLMKDPQTIAMTRLVATILIKGIQNGDQTRANFLFDRAFGKVQENHKHTLDGDIHATLVRMMAEVDPDEEE